MIMSTSIAAGVDVSFYDPYSNIKFLRKCVKSFYLWEIVRSLKSSKRALEKFSKMGVIGNSGKRKRK